MSTSKALVIGAPGKQGMLRQAPGSTVASIFVHLLETSVLSRRHAWLTKVAKGDLSINRLSSQLIYRIGVFQVLLFKKVRFYISGLDICLLSSDGSNIL
jgi:hypothetical protein